jgi:hypothetical protein
LIKGEAKLNILNKPDDERLVSAYNLISAFNNLTYINFKMDSLILTQNEELSLKEMLNLKELKLVYRASRDGFAAYSFHSKCDGISNTVTIIKTTSNSVFGGFTSATWTSYGYWTYDPNAFIFSLRRSGISNKERLNVTNPYYAIYGHYSYGPTFGGGHDIYVSDYSNTNEYSSSNLGHSYQLPENTTYGSEEAKIYLAGSYTWQTTEIEVYQLVTPFLPYSEPYSVSFLHNGCLIIISYYILN